MRIDLCSDILARAIVGPIAANADNTPAKIDLQGYKSATILIGVGSGGITFDDTNKVEFKLTHADEIDDAGTEGAYAAVEAKDMTNVTPGSGGIIKSLVAAHAAAAWYQFGYVGGKRYLKLLNDFSGTHGAATPIATLVLLGHPELRPTA